MALSSKSEDRPLVSQQPKQLLVDLALQGGGAHGAFTWGVLDRLLDDRWQHIDGISGTSAGAMNAAVLVHGFVRGGAAGARRALEQFWLQVSEAALLSPFQRTPLDVLLGRWTLDNSPVFIAADLMASQPVLTSPAWPIAPSSFLSQPQMSEPGGVGYFANEGARWAWMRVHRIAGEVMLDLGYSSKLNAERAFLAMLRDEGRKAAHAFLQAHADDLGKRSSLDLDDLSKGV